ncbi:MAG: hypothetical protein IPJ46_10470 [Anaerolineales bacterium]|nr:hypothetical protein [Anaerolineales bacterium]
MNIKLISAFLALALASMACGFELPKAPAPEPEVTENMSVPAPDSDQVNLNLAFGAGELTLAPGSSQLVDGTATYNYSAFKPVIKTDGSNVQVGMSEVNFNVFPSFKDLKNIWDLKLGTTPMDLSIEAGAYEGTFELGGLALNNLSIKDGAADVELSFSQPNLTEMSIFEYGTGASNVKMSGLANANFSLMDFSSGAGDYTLDFSGELQRDASITISSGLSNMIIVVPEDVNAIVTVDSGASNVNAGSGWEQNGKIYKQAGEGPMLTFVINIGAGNVTLTK